MKLIYAEAGLGLRPGKWDQLGQHGQEGGLLAASGKTKYARGLLCVCVCVSGKVKSSSRVVSLECCPVFRL